MIGLNTNPILIIDATGAEKGRRRFTRDAIGAGPRSIAGILEKHSIDCQILQAEDVIVKGFPKGFSTLFISAMSMDKIAVRKIVQKWRKQSSGKVVLGGPITSEKEPVLKATKADLIVIAEGEKTLEELIEKKALINDEGSELYKIKGIGFQNKEKVIINEARFYSTREEFRSFQPSTKRIIDYPNFFFAKVYVECVRGCSNFKGTKIKLPDGRECSNCGYCESNCLEERLSCPEGIPPGCGFCSVPNLFGPARSRKEGDIAQEIKELLELGVKRIILSAPDFLDFGREEKIFPKPLMQTSEPKANIEQISLLLSKISALKQVKNDSAWVEIENVKASLFTEENAKIIAQYLPNSSFSIGCETGSEKHAKLLGRPSSPKDTLRAVKLANKYGLRAHVYFIHSLPGQTAETVNETIKLIYQLEPFIEKITIYRFRPLPLSAFGNFPEPQPAKFNPLSKKIVEAANEVNVRKKKDYLGKKMKVIISEPNFHVENSVMAIMIEGGPKVTINDAIDKIGQIVTVKIVKALSDRLLLGELITS